MKTTAGIALLRTVPSPGTQACGLAWDGEAFWYFDLKVKTLFRVAMDGKVIKTHELGCGCCDTAFDGRNIWQAEPDQRMILVIDPGSGKVVRKLQTPDKTSGLCTDGTNWYRGSWTRQEIIRFDPRTGDELGAAPTGASTSGMAWDGSHIWHGGEIEGNNFLFKVDRQKGEVVRYAADFTICGLTFDGESLWAADGDRNLFVQIQPE